MVKDSISLYTVDRHPLSLGHLTLKPGKFIEDIFDAVEDNETFETLTTALRGVIYNALTIDRQTPRYIRYVVTDSTDFRMYLKIKIKENV